MIHDGSAGGASLVDFLRDVADGKVPEASVKDRLDATKFLLERAYGKAPQVIDVRGRVEHAVTGSYDLGKLTDEQLRQLGDALAVAALPAKSVVEDAVLVEDEDEG